jgi:hypothetical protein
MVARHRRRRLGTVGSGSYSFAMFLGFPGADSRGSRQKGSQAHPALLSLGYILQVLNEEGER